MKIVRFTETAFGETPEPRWGVIVDEWLFPTWRPPYLAPAGAPEIDGPPLRLESVRLLAPVQPSKIVCVGRNYAEHAAELGNEVPGEPLIFFKPPSSLIGPGDEVVHPSISERVDHEGELALVIGRQSRNLSEDEAMDAIFGYTVANDVTARDIQKGDKQWTRGKGFDTFCPVGPWIDTTFDPLAGEQGATVRCLVNNEVRQESTTSLLIFPIAHVLAYITRAMTLEPGDLVLTGTPAGVAPVQPGDVMTVEVEGLGSISNTVVAE